MDIEINSPLTIIGLKIENVKKIRSVRISPDPNYVELGGRNAQGKSTVLDSIAYALGGEKLCPERPIRDGEDSGEVSVDLSEEITVKRNWTSKGSYVSVTAKGAKKKSPQAILDEICGKLTFDPLAFSRMAKSQHKETLIDLLGIREALAKTDKQIAAVFENRTEWNKEVDRLRSLIASNDLVEPVGLPKEPVSMSTLLAELDAAHKVNAQNDSARRELVEFQTVERGSRNAVESYRLDVEKAERELKEAREGLAKAEEKLAADAKRTSDIAAGVNEIEDIDTAEISNRLKGLEETNALIKSAAAAKENREALKKATEAADLHTAKIEQLRKDKDKIIKEAKYPVAGLGFSADGVLFKGLPFEQASDAEKIIVSIAIAMKLNPTLRILLIRDGSLLDDETLEQIRTAIKGEGYQLWIERVGDDGGPGTLVIEDGEIAAVMPADEAARAEVKAGLKARRSKR